MSLLASERRRHSLARLALATAIALATGCAAPPPVVTFPKACDCNQSAAQPTDANLRNQVVALTRRVAALEDLAHPERHRSAEWRELDEVGAETFWQRRFAPEKRDVAWAQTVEPAVAQNVAGDATVTMLSLECRTTLCRLEVICKDPSHCSPGLAQRGHRQDPNMGAQFCDAHFDKNGVATKVVFLFREGRSMVPSGDP